MGQSDQKGVANNAQATKKLGGVTGKGFMPGQSGNPEGGRLKKKWLTDVTEELLEEMLSDPVQREQYKDSLRQKLLSQRVVGAMTLDKIWERTEGKVSQPVEMNINLALADRLERARKRKK